MHCFDNTVVKFYQVLIDSSPRKLTGVIRNEGKFLGSLNSVRTIGLLACHCLESHTIMSVRTSREQRQVKCNRVNQIKSGRRFELCTTQNHMALTLILQSESLFV
jgi:hypothetical protein